MVARRVGGVNVKVTPSEAHALTEAIAVWVEGRSDLKSLGLAGSWVRGSARANSDLDLLILADNPELYRSTQDWLLHILLPGPFRIASHSGATYGVVWSCHVALEPAAELELSFGSLDWASTNPVDAGTRRIISDGLRVIVDKDGRLQRIVESVKSWN